MTGVQTRAALYLSVSTGRQATNDLSIPDQRRQLEAHCEAKGWEAAVQYVEPGNNLNRDGAPGTIRTSDPQIRRVIPRF